MAKKTITLEHLAQMIQRGFKEVASREDIFRVERRIDLIERQIAEINKRIEHIEGEIKFTNARLSVLERDIAEMRKTYIRPQEFEDALLRISYLERKLGIKSGK